MTGITFHQLAIIPVLHELKNALAFVTKGYEYTKAQNIDPNDFLTARLHPDMADFIFQINRFTEAAKGIPSRVNPSIEDIMFSNEEKTFPELIARIEKTIMYLEGIDASSLEGREDAEVILLIRGGTLEVRLTGMSYVTQFAHANFW